MPAGPSRTDRPGGERVVRLGEDLPEAFQDDYWGKVSQVLQEVFKLTARDAADAVQKARERLSAAEHEKGPQTFFYHASPLEVAVSLGGHRGRILSAEQKSAYLELLKSWNPSGREDFGEDVAQVQRDHLRVPHPEY